MRNQEKNSVPSLKWNSKSKKFWQLQKSGRIRPFLLALIILITGLWLDKWWWQIGMITIIIIFIESCYRYQTHD